MAAREDTPEKTAWIDDDQDDLTDMELEMEEDDELYLDDIDSDDDDVVIDIDGDDADSRLTRLVDRYQAFSARRRIEIAREDKWLKSVMADFDDYDSLDEQNDGPVSEGLSY